jgi:preprotein translocase subunit Sec61beta
MKSSKKSAKDKEGYYAVSGFVSAVLVLLIHFLLLSKIDMHPTIHVAIGLFIFFLLSSLLSSLLSRVWNKL